MILLKVLPAHTNIVNINVIPMLKFSFPVVRRDKDKVIVYIISPLKKKSK
jgi:hypothetical protein